MKSNVILYLLNSNYIHFQFVFLFIQLINVTLDEIVKKRNNPAKNNQNEAKKDKIKTTIGVACFLVLLFSILFLFLSINLFKTTFMIVNTSFLIYILIICPLLSIKLTYSFKNDSTMITSFLFTEIFCIKIFGGYDFLVSLIGDEIILQVTIIIAIVIKLLLLSYFIMITTYNIIKNFNILVMDNLNKKIDELIKKIDEKYNLEYLDNLLVGKKCFLIKGFIFIYKSIIWILMVLIVRGFIFSVYTIYNFISKFFKNDSNSIFYILSKLSLIISLLSTYCIIMFTNEFNASIISILELIISTLIIPIILEMLLSRKNTNYTNNN